jgi:hypothetical protein
MTLFENQLRHAQFSDGVPVIDALCYAPPTVTYTGSISASTDPFAAKTNKYAESQVVELFSTVVFHVKFSAAGTAATTSDAPFPANIKHRFVIAKDYPYMRIIPTTGTATYYINEVY